MPRFANTLGRVIGYHGCDRKVAEKILSGRDEVHVSVNDYDWLGQGAYFWVDSPLRAFRWAQDAKERDALNPPKHRKPIYDPYVVGAFINTGLCLNFLDYDVIKEIQNVHKIYEESIGSDDIMPQNSSSRNGITMMRRLDCTIINYVHYKRATADMPRYDTALGMFLEGEPAYAGAGFNAETHVQIAVLRPEESIIGYFRPRYMPNS